MSFLTKGAAGRYVLLKEVLPKSVWDYMIKSNIEETNSPWMWYWVDRLAHNSLVVELAIYFRTLSLSMNIPFKIGEEKLRKMALCYEDLTGARSRFSSMVETKNASVSSPLLLLRNAELSTWCRVEVEKIIEDRNWDETGVGAEATFNTHFLLYLDNEPGGEGSKNELYHRVLNILKDGARRCRFEDGKEKSRAKRSYNEESIPGLILSRGNTLYAGRLFGELDPSKNGLEVIRSPSPGDARLEVRETSTGETNQVMIEEVEMCDIGELDSSKNGLEEIRSPSPGEARVEVRETSTGENKQIMIEEQTHVETKEEVEMCDKREQEIRKIEQELALKKVELAGALGWKEALEMQQRIDARKERRTNRIAFLEKKLTEERMEKERLMMEIERLQKEEEEEKMDSVSIIDHIIPHLANKLDDNDAKAEGEDSKLPQWVPTGESNDE